MIITVLLQEEANLHTVKVKNHNLGSNPFLKSLYLFAINTIFKDHRAKNAGRRSPAAATTDPHFAVQPLNLG